MVNGATTQATEMINNQDDKNAVSMSLGNSGIDANVKSTAEINTDDYKPTKDPEFAEYDPEREAEYWQKQETEQEAQKTEAEYETEYLNTLAEIERIQELYDKIHSSTNYDPKFSLEMYKQLSDKEKAKIWGGWSKERGYGVPYQERYGIARDYLMKKYTDQLAEQRNERDRLYGKFDNRTDEQKRSDQLLAEQRKRDDTAYQRASDDLSKAGYNPNYLKGVNYGGGGGGGGLGSKADDEEEKRKRRKRELEAERQAQKQQQQNNIRMLMSVLGTMGGIGGSIGGALIRNKGLKGMAETRASGYIDSQELRNMNAIELQKMRQSGNMRLQNKRHQHNQERDNIRYLFRNKEVNDRNYQNIQRDKRRRYGYYDDIDLDETYMQQHNRKKYGR